MNVRIVGYLCVECFTLFEKNLHSRKGFRSFVEEGLHKLVDLYSHLLDFYWRLFQFESIDLVPFIIQMLQVDCPTFCLVDPDAEIPMLVDDIEGSRFIVNTFYWLNFFLEHIDLLKGHLSSTKVATHTRTFGVGINAPSKELEEKLHAQVR